MQKPLTVREAAEALGVASITIRRLIYSEQISYRKIGKQYFFCDTDISEYLENARHPARSAAGDIQ
jgi:excisionase family DNA binding protein